MAGCSMEHGIIKLRKHFSDYYFLALYWPPRHIAVTLSESGQASRLLCPVFRSGSSLGDQSILLKHIVTPSSISGVTKTVIMFHWLIGFRSESSFSGPCDWTRRETLHCCQPAAFNHALTFLKISFSKNAAHSGRNLLSCWFLPVHPDATSPNPLTLRDGELRSLDSAPKVFLCCHL